MVRILLERLYLLSAALGALLFVAIELLILYQLGGQFLPYIPRSADEFAGYCMAASAFLALAYTFHSNEHIRVTFLVDRLNPISKRLATKTAVSLSLILSGYLAWHFIKLTYLSWQLNDLSNGLIALPLWIPQSAMATGATIFFIAVLQRTVDVWRGAAIETITRSSEELAHVDG
jgi:TRAP-type C4-dicarboxylate transport system permease small subunit